jgi:hypothetical protein
VDVDWYADLLRSAAHGAEISGVTIRIVPWEEVRSSCGPSAAGCYGGPRGRGVIIVPAGRSAEVAHTLIHEYGHHVDSSRRHGGLPEPNGTPAWWRARGLAELSLSGQVAQDYSLGWDRSIGEIFAEDYAQLHLAFPYKIGWLGPPDESVRAALLRDLGAEEPPAVSPRLDPVVIQRTGTLRPGERRSLPFRLLGPGRMVTFTVNVDGAARAGARARIELVCGDQVRIKRLGRGRLSTTIRAGDLGPGDREVALASTSTSPRRYAVELRLAVAAL